MIETLRIESFKSIAEAQLDLGQVNVFIGANGSGKSNLLEAIALLSAAASGKVDQSTLVWRGTRASGYFRPMFEGTSPFAQISMEANGAHASYEVKLIPPDEDRPQSWRYKSERLIGNGEVVADRSGLADDRSLDRQVGYAALKLAETSPNNPASVFLKALASYSIYSADTPILHGWVKDPQAREPMGLGGGGLGSSIADLRKMKDSRSEVESELSACFDWFAGIDIPMIGLGDIEILFRDRFFRKDKHGSFSLSTNDVNEGVLFLAFLAVLGLHPRAPKIFAVENVDHGLNPRLAKRMMTTLAERILKAEDRQAFLTTHNPLVLDGLPLRDERVRLFTVARTDAGRSVIRRVEVNDKLLKMADQGWTLSRLWVMGHIGGVPNV